MDTLDSFFGRLRAQQSLFISGASGEPRPLVEALAGRASELPDLEICSSFLPGVNSLTLVGNDNRLTETALFPRPNGSDNPDRIRVLPLTYYAANHYLAKRKFDWVIVQLSAPDRQGRCSLGTAVEFLPAVLNGAQNVVGVINRQMPYLPGSPTLSLADLDLRLEVDWPLVTQDPAEADETSLRIANNLLRLIDNDATLQLGLGRVPASLLSLLGEARGLKIHSGLLSAGFQSLYNAGALATGFGHCACTALGGAEFYRWLADCDDVSITGVGNTHDPAKLATRDRFIAINSALQVDLLGQANLESANGMAVSAVGGAPDFARASRNARQGESIIALPATAARGSVSRIVAGLQPGQPVSLGRHDIDHVVTEYGIADLRDQSPPERARALIDVAAPEFRAQLFETLAGGTP